MNRPDKRVLKVGGGGINLGGRKFFDPFAANVPVMKKPGSRLALVTCVKNTCGRGDILNKDEGN